MSDSESRIHVEDAEALARYVVARNQRPRGTDPNAKVEPSAFVAAPGVELSVVRHTGLTESDLWHYGRIVAAQRGRNLHGRADVIAGDVRAAKPSNKSESPLKVLQDPLLENPNHAIIIGYPFDVDAQNELAIQIAEASTYAPAPAL